MAHLNRIGPAQLKGKIIDVHTHVGIGLCCYLGGSYPYCQDVEALLYRMDANGVDCAVAFPFWESPFFDPRPFLARRLVRPHRPPLTEAPFVVENRRLCEEVYEKSPRAAGRVLPFAAIDPGRLVRRQLGHLERLAEEYPLYGLKVTGVAIRSSHRHLLGKGAGFIDFARRRNWPVLLHTTAYEGDRLCHFQVNLEIVRRFPDVRFCLAHCMGFHKAALDRADALPNAWVDSAAMKIQVEAEAVIAPPRERLPSDYSDYRRVFRDLVRAYPDTMLWGSDSPAFTFMESRGYADGSLVTFRLAGSYEQEKAALDALPSPAARRRVANRNTCRFLFGT